jgi:tetratricopeptide (TPR) repeat protein
MLGQIVRAATETQEDEPIEVRRARVRKRVARHAAPPDQLRVAEFLGELAGSPFPDDDSVRLRAARADASLMRDQLEHAWTTWLGAESGAKPVLLVLEDVHWGDLPSLRLIDVALRTMRNRPWLVLALGRPDVHEAFPRLWVDRRVHEIRLEELSPRACEALVRAALGEAAGAEVVTRLVEQSAGVPFYLEELVRAEASGRGSQVPETVLGMLQARLERLDLDTRRVLRAASVFGGSFQRGGVAALCGGDDRVREVLAALEEHELVERRPDGSSRDTEFVFRHALVRDAAYASLTEADRALGHRLAGRWLEDKGDPDAVTLAEHFERAGDSTAAVRWFQRAAEQALDGFDLEATVSRATRGIACGAEGEQLGALRLLQSEAHLWRGDLGGAEREALSAMRDLPPGSARWFKAALGLLMQSASQGREDQIERFIGELAESQSTQRSGAETTAFALSLRLLAMKGNRLVARLFFDRLAAIDRETPNEPSISAMLPAGQFYWWSFIDWDPWARMKACERGVRECALVGHVMHTAMSRVHVAWSYWRAGAPEDAKRILEETLELATARGVGGLVPDFASVHLGAALGLLGRSDEGESALTQAIPRLVGSGNWLIGALARVELAALHLTAGAAAAAEQQARIACEALTPVPPVRLGAEVVLARALLALGESTRALAVARGAVQVIDSSGCVTEADVRVRLAHADALAACGDGEGAERELQRAAALLGDRAARIPDLVWRNRFLNNVPEHASLLARYPIPIS